MSFDLVARALAQKALTEGGGPGQSAYQIALANGFVGSQADWLASLKGEDGAGGPGASAFEIAVENGFAGTEAEWLASLKGEDGAGGDPDALAALQAQLATAMVRIAVLESPDALSPLALDPDTLLEGVEPGALVGHLTGLHPFETITQNTDAGGRLLLADDRILTGLVGFDYAAAQAHVVGLHRRLAKPGRPVVEADVDLTVGVIPHLRALDLPAQEVPGDLAEGALLLDIGTPLPGETRTILPADGRVVVKMDGSKLLRGATPWAAGETDFTLLQIHPTATNSPKETTWSVTILPEPDTLTPTENLASFTERGITWNLAAAAPVGQYVAGDYFALNSVVTSVLPASAQFDGIYDDGSAYTGRWGHGLMINPGRDGGTGANPTLTPQSFDDLPKSPLYSSSVTELAYYHPGNGDPSVTGQSISGVKSLVKAHSILVNPEASGRAKLDNISVLTLVDAIPPVGSFRRWPGAVSKTPIFFASDVDWAALITLPKPAAATTLVAADLIAKLGPLQTFMNQMLYTRGINSSGVQSRYGAEIANDINQAMLFTMTAGTSDADRKAVGYKLIQAGLDIYDATEAGRRWSSATFSFGGAHQWVKILLAYAAKALRNAANVTERNKLTAWCDGTINRIFAEDMCTFPINRARIESSPSGSITTRLWPTGYPDWSENSIDWLSKPSGTESCGLAYELAYRTVNSYPWLAQALIVRMLGAEALWNNPVFFEYCDTFYDKWTLKGQPTDVYFAPYCRFFVIDYYTTYGPIFSDATGPTLVRRMARSRFAWMEFNENFTLASAHQPAAADLTVTVDGSAVSLASFITTASGAYSTGSTNMAQPVITVANATGIRIGQRVVCASLRPDTRVTSINGNTVGISTTVPNASFSNQPITFENVFVHGRAMVAVLPVPLTSAAQPVTMGYAAPGSGYVRNLGGVGLASVAVAAATNYTGVLPAGPAGKDLAYSGPDPATRQYSGGGVFRSQSFKRFRASIRFSLKELLAANAVLLSSINGATGTFKVYSPSTGALRIFIGGSAAQGIRAPSAFSGVPLDTLITMHFMFDGTVNGTQAQAKKVAVVWNGGGNITHDTSTSTGTIDGTFVGDITAVFSQGLFAFATGGGSDPFHGGIKEFTIGWGDETLPLPADFSGAAFAHDADWGPNGAGPWGQNQLAFAGPLSEWNGGVPNRGSYGAYSLTPRRFIDPTDPDSGLALLFTAPIPG